MAEDTGILTVHNAIVSYGSHNCSWIIIAPNPGTVPDFLTFSSKNISDFHIYTFLDTVRRTYDNCFSLNASFI
jgi:hypothetical protein